MLKKVTTKRNVPYYANYQCGHISQASRAPSFVFKKVALVNSWNLAGIRKLQLLILYFIASALLSKEPTTAYFISLKNASILKTRFPRPVSATIGIEPKTVDLFK